MTKSVYAENRRDSDGLANIHGSTFAVRVGRGTVVLKESDKIKDEIRRIAKDCKMDAFCH